MAKMTKEVKKQQIDGLTNNLLNLLDNSYNIDKCKDIAIRLIELGWENAHNYQHCYMVTSQEYEFCNNYIDKNNYNILINYLEEL